MNFLLNAIMVLTAFGVITYATVRALDLLTEPRKPTHERIGLSPAL